MGTFRVSEHSARGRAADVTGIRKLWIWEDRRYRKMIEPAVPVPCPWNDCGQDRSNAVTRTVTLSARGRSRRPKYNWRCACGVVKCTVWDGGKVRVREG